ncbi:hypothetical protein M6B38_418265 [Iris pallida]|uniref:Uncharacterized protein n=1 Tax=Iris pallida TaxID=29817 RepID=A0AAX6FJQ7_IRIPA|nr:hypothetical protein M6B38_418265 [Iris pallida]
MFSGAGRLDPHLAAPAARWNIPPPFDAAAVPSPTNASPCGVPEVDPCPLPPLPALPSSSDASTVAEARSVLALTYCGGNRRRPFPFATPYALPYATPGSLLSDDPPQIRR